MNFHSRKIGGVQVTALNDGHVEVGLRVLRGIADGAAENLLEEAGQPVPPLISVNAYALHLPAGIVLVDTGAGTSMGAGLGRLPESLAAAGIRREDVAAVLLTHAHPDHSNGLTDASGAALFPNAELVVHADEKAHWFDDGARSRVSVRQQQNFFDAVRFQFAPYLGRLRLFRRGEVFPGVQMVPLAGHTPGHSGYLVESGKESLLIWGDTVHVPDVQVQRPEVFVVLDVDAVAAVGSRRRVLDMAAAERVPIAGMHTHFPGFAMIARAGVGYALEPLQ